MLKIAEMSRRAISPEFAETRAACGGLAIFAATLATLGVLAAVITGFDLRSVVSNDDAIPPAYAQVISPP